MSPLEKYGTFFSTLERDFKEEMFIKIFDDNAYFRDPFQEVVGVQPIINVFRHMYTMLKNPRFVILDAIGDRSGGYLRWKFFYNDTYFEGVSHVEFNNEGKVTSHIDYWDAGSNVYEKIPLLGSILCLIKRKLRA